MKTILLVLLVPLLSGCFVIIKDEDKTKIFGENREIAIDTLRRTEGITSGETSVSENNPEEQSKTQQFLK
ncbi:MAG: hypothetical protein KBA46_01900 [Candidatus Omnitrophica bacterium]|nr:hypothetical protein [Candidatus Omnitrophota bacterium]